MDLKNLSQVYDKFAESYDDNRELFNIDNIISDFRNRLDTPGALLDIGCGAGIPVGKSFVDNAWAVTGVDFSSKMLALANTHVPEMKTICADMRDIQFDDEEFDAISMIYSLFHIPNEQQSELFTRLYRWLKPNGMALFTYATKEYTGSEQFNGNKEFLGQQLFYSHDTPDNLFQTLEDIGFAIEARDYHCVADETFLWVTMRKPAS